MANTITSVVLKKVVDGTSGARVDQAISLVNGDAGYTTRYTGVAARTGSIIISGGYTRTTISTSTTTFIGVSIGPEDNSYDHWYPMPAARTTPGSATFSITIPESVLPRGPGKIHFAVRLVVKNSSTAGYTYWYGQEDVVRNSFYADRKPARPTILGPNSGISMVAGNMAGSAYLNWDFDDPDKVGAANTPLLEDYGGFQVQTRLAPTLAVPNPPWSTPTLSLSSSWPETPPGSAIPNTGVFLYRDKRGWLLRVDPDGYGEPDRYITDFKRIRIVPFPHGTVPTGGGLDTTYDLGLGEGTWQIRVRTFDRAAADGPRDANWVPAYYYSSPDVVPITAVSDWSNPITIYIVGNALPPLLNYPVDGESATGNINFQWTFQTPVAGRTQRNWYLYIKAIPDAAYTLVAYGDVLVTDTRQNFVYVNGSGGLTMVPGNQYQWTMITRDSSYYYSQGAVAQRFWYAASPTTGPELPLPEITVPDPGLGCGTNRVFVYSRGGKVPLGEITDITQVSWSRVRDDISSCDVAVSDWDSDCGALLASLRSWQHELVVFRDNGSGSKRVWEGPIVRVGYEVDQVSIEAKDVMGYVYRRILRNGYNDAYRFGGGGLTTVTNRARIIIQNALAYDDPNVLSYLWVLNRADDAKTSRVVEPWSRTAWQEVDDLAAKAGLDYTTVGRRIMLWDTHSVIGLLPEMRDGDFDSPPIVTEYGMRLANVYAVSNNSGVWGEAKRQPPRFYGYVEMLVSAWGESDDNGQPETLTAAAEAALRESLDGQAERGIAQRWPTPLVVRIPDNSTLSPDLSIGINQLIPGVHIPLLSNNTLRRVRQVQKLDSLKVTQTSAGEQVQVTLSPAPTTADYNPDDAGALE